MADLTAALDAEENRAEAAELLRTLVDRIEVTPNAQGQLDIDLFGDLAGILTMAQNREKPLNSNDEAIQQVKLVAGARSPLFLLFATSQEAWRFAYA